MSPRTRTQATSRAAWASVASNSALIAGKLVVGLLAGSVSIIAEALHSGMDLAASFMALFSVRRAGEPADGDHRYGHGKFESLSGLLEGLLILAAAVLIVYVAVHRIIHGAQLENEGLGVAIMAVSSLVNAVIARYLFRIAKAHDSLALSADAWHHWTDVYSSVAVLVAVGAIYFGAPPVLDPIGAIVVALVIVHAAYQLCADASAQLLDRALPLAEEQAIVMLIQEHAGQFVSFHNMRTRKAGAERHVDLHLVMAPEVSVAEAHDIVTHLEQEIVALFPGTTVITHMEPPGSRDLPTRT